MTLKELRIQNGKTIKEVATYLKLTDRAVGNYEAGRRRISLESVISLSKLYGESAETVINAQLNSESERPIR